MYANKNIDCNFTYSTNSFNLRNCSPSYSGKNYSSGTYPMDSFDNIGESNETKKPSSKKAARSLQMFQERQPTMMNQII